MSLKIVAVAALSLSLGAAHAQSVASLPNAPEPGSVQDTSLRNTPRNILRDQAAIWTSPLHIRESNMVGPLLLVGATTVLITTDHQVMSEHLHDASLNRDANTASTGLTGLFVAAPIGFYGVGRMTRDLHAQETGVLAGEAIVDSIAVNEAFKIISRRERPDLDGARGKFFQPGVNFNSSFASNHCVMAWSSAAVIASAYDGYMTKITAYTLATGVTLTRVVGRDHFPSDVLVGSAVGWMIGRYVHHRHHRAELM